jgi:hypothetical protein
MTGWTGKRLLAVVAHPDDETFGLGSLIAAATTSSASTLRGPADRSRPSSASAGPRSER